MKFVYRFQAQVEQLKQRIFRIAQPKALAGSVLSGVGLIKMIDVVIDAINSGKVPQIASTWSAVAFLFLFIHFQSI